MLVALTADGAATGGNKSVSAYDQIRCTLGGIRCREAALLLISASVLSYHVILVRAFSIGQWHHFPKPCCEVIDLGP